MTKYLSVERERSRKYSVSWQQKHSASELQKISRAIVYLQAKGVATLDDLDAALSSVDGRAKALNESVKTKEGRMKKLQKLIEQGGHYNRFKPVHDELKALKNGWGKKREKFEREHESDLIIWNAANRYLHANLPEGTRSLDISGWQREYNELKAQTAAEYEELKAARSEVRELQQIRRCIALQERAWLEKDIDIEGELAPVTFYGSEDLVEHIWSNLISNAIRFTPPGGQISVVLRQEGGEVCVTVSDTGCGMDEQTQTHIFDKFYKGAAQQSPGNGLGLAIVRRAVELCGGSIRVASSPGCGSSFFVTLPSADG